MPDREKVIKGLEHCDFGVSDTCYEKECPYYQSHDCTDELKNDILTLLKEHEPTRVESVGYGTDMFKRYRCQTCKAFFDHKYNYCPSCGRKIKWND